MAPHSSTLAQKIPWMEEPDRLQSMGLLTVWHDSATSLSLFTFMHWRRKWQPIPVLLPGKYHGQKSLAGYSPWGCKESDTTERLSAHTHTHTYTHAHTRTHTHIIKEVLQEELLSFYHKQAALKIDKRQGNSLTGSTNHMQYVNIFMIQFRQFSHKVHFLRQLGKMED